jgi:4-amino-4-deoxy-L-arabinose transferase-like glycosyltransferase
MIDATDTRKEAAALPLDVASLGGYEGRLAAITAVALASRVLWLGSVPRFWGDEAFNGVQVRKPFRVMLDVVRHDSHPPLLYVLQKVVALVSTSPAALRLVSALAGTAAVVLAGILGRRIGGDRAGLLAAAVLAAFPAFVLASRDSRGYSLAMTLVLASALALWRAAEHPSRGRLLTYAACVAAAVYTHYFTIPAIGGQLLVALWVLRPPRRTATRLLLAGAGGGLTLLPWLVAASPQFQHATAPFWVHPIHLGSLVSDIGSGLSQTPGHELTTVATWLAEAAAIPLLVVAFRRALPGTRRGMLFLLGCALLPTLASLAFSLWKPVYDARFLSLFWGPGEVVVGASLAVIRWRGAAIAVCLALAAAAGISLTQIQRPQFAAVMAPLDGKVQAGDIVVVNGPDHYYSVAYAADAATNRALRVVADDVPWYFGTAGYAPGTVIHSIPDVPGRVYLIGDAGQRPPALPPGFHRVQRNCHDGICVDSFGR